MEALRMPLSDKPMLFLSRFRVGAVLLQPHRLMETGRVRLCLEGECLLARLEGVSGMSQKGGEPPGTPACSQSGV